MILDARSDDGEGDDKDDEDDKDEDDDDHDEDDKDDDEDEDEDDDDDLGNRRSSRYILATWSQLKVHQIRPRPPL